MTAALDDLRLRGAKLTGEVSQAVIGAPVLDLTLGQVSQLTFTLVDPGFRLLSTGLFDKRTPVDFRDQRLEIAVVTTGGDAGAVTLEVSARATGAQRLKRAKGSLVVTNQSPTQFAADQAREVGMEFVGEPSAVRPQISRAGGESGRQDQSTWDLIQDLAGELGYVAFETSGTLFFGRPTWIVDRHRVTRRWTVRYPYARPGELAPLTVPQCRRSDDADDPVEVRVDLPRLAGEVVRPGDVLTVVGVPTFDGDYLVTNVPIAFDTAPITVTATTPIDPDPKPADEARMSGLDWADALYEGLDFDQGYEDLWWPEPDTGTQFTWPVWGIISSQFGMRNGRMHKGIDIARNDGARIYASADGRVRHAGWLQGYGLVVYLDHGGGYQTRYAHMRQVAVSAAPRHEDTWGALTVPVQERVGGVLTSSTPPVRRGQLLGYVGSTGRSTGPHLHFEIRKNGEAVDPRGYLRGSPRPTLTGGLTPGGGVQV